MAASSLDFDGDACAVFGWLPLIAHATDSRVSGQSRIQSKRLRQNSPETLVRARLRKKARERLMSVTGTPVNAIFSLSFFSCCGFYGLFARHRPNHQPQ